MEINQDKEELSAMASILGAIKKRELHKCPEGYFDNLADEVLSKINEAPVLFGIDKKELHQAPEGYFETFSVPSITKKIIPLRTQVLRWTAVAASICVIITGSYFIFGENNIPVKEIASVNTTTHEEYANYLMDELPDEDLYAFVSENEPSVADTTNEVVDYLINESSDYDLEDFE